VRVAGCADHGDPAGRPKDPLDALVVEDRDRPPTLLEIQDGAHALALAPPLGGRIAAGRVVIGQVAPSFTYGLPTAAGATLRPTTPARTMRVSR
jgi:hypothetical protein